MASNTVSDVTAEHFVEKLRSFQSDEELRKIRRYFKSGRGEYGEVDEFMGVRMGPVFAVAKEFIDLAPVELEKLLESPVHEIRAGAVSIMAKQVGRKKTTAGRKKEMFELYIRRHDRINNWDLVDLGAPYVVGGYLADKPRTLLRKLARSKNMWERRTAIVSTAYFLMRGEVVDTFEISEMLPALYGAARRAGAPTSAAGLQRLRLCCRR